jgi:hypothetical protein
MKIITLDIKELYVNLPLQYILYTTKFWLNRSNNTNATIKHTLQLIEIILKQNYFQYNNQIFRSEKGIAMGSPISGTIAEIYVQFLEELYIKQWMDSKQILYYKRYVDDILIIYDQNKTNEHDILNQANNIDKHLQFKLSTEENSIINCLDLTICRSNSNIEVGIYRKPTSTDTAIHFTSNHPYEHKLAAFNNYINRMLTIPITKHQQQERKPIQTIPRNNGLPIHIIHNLKEKLEDKKQKQQQQKPLTPKTQHKKRWVTFTYHSPLIRKITNLFKHSNLRIALRTTNTTFQQLIEKPVLNNPSGIYKLKCNTCNKAYIGQSGRSIAIRHKEHLRYTGCPRRKGPNFGRVFLRSNYTEITQNTCIQSSIVTEILAREKCGLLWCLRTVLCP